MKVHCRTNLDLRGEIWPTELPAIPRPGDHVQSATVWNDRFQLVLQVVRVTWKVQGAKPGKQSGEWYPEIELHMTDWQRQMPCNGRFDGCECSPGSICAFYHWYAPLIGTTASAFI